MTDDKYELKKRLYCINSKIGHEWEPLVKITVVEVEENQLSRRLTKNTLVKCTRTWSLDMWSQSITHRYTFVPSLAINAS